MPDAAQGAGATAEDQTASRHQTPSLDADITIDEQFTAGHGVTYAVESLTGTLNANPTGVTQTQAEHIADIDAVACRLQFDTFDLRSGLAGKKIWNKR
jgi:hypothetical protein